MYTQRILKDGAIITISIDIKDLPQSDKEDTENTLRKQEGVKKSDGTETYSTPKQASEILDVDLSTLWRWKKRGYLVPIEVGGRRRYKMSDINKILGGNK